MCKYYIFSGKWGYPLRYYIFRMADGGGYTKDMREAGLFEKHQIGNALILDTPEALDNYMKHGGEKRDYAVPVDMVHWLGKRVLILQKM